MRKRRYRWIAATVVAAVMVGFVALRHARAPVASRGESGRKTWVRPGGVEVLDTWTETHGVGDGATTVRHVKTRDPATGKIRVETRSSGGVPAAAGASPSDSAAPVDRIDPRLRARFRKLREEGRDGEPLTAIVWFGLSPADRAALDAAATAAAPPKFEPSLRQREAAGTAPDPAWAGKVAAAEADLAARRRRIAERFRAAADRFLAAAAVPDARVVYRFALGPGVALRLNEAEAERLARHTGVNYLFAEEQAEKELDYVVPALKGPTAWAEGFDGSGATVAHIEPEPGRVATDNPYLAATVFRPAGGLDWHATAIAGILRSTHSTYRGLAYGCSLLDANAASTNETDLGAATDWALTNGASVVNMSYGLADATDGSLHWSDIYYDYMVFYGRALFTKSAGNSGARISSPGRGYNSLTVGAVDDFVTVDWGDDEMCLFSSYLNPVTGTEKPEIAAYGDAYGDGSSGSGGIYSTTTNSPWFGAVGYGTSYAAPQVAGIAALCIDRTPALAGEPETLKAKIMASGLAHNIEGAARLSSQDGAGKALATAVNAGSYSVTLTDASFDTNGFYELPITIPLVSNDTERLVLAWSYPPVSQGATPDPSSYLKADLDLHLFIGGSEVTSSTYGVENPFEIIDYTPGANATGVVKIARASWTNALPSLRVGLAYVAKSELGDASDPYAQPPPPTGLVAQDGTAYGDVELSWDAVDAATGYYLYYDEDGSPPFSPTQDGSPASGSDLGHVTNVTVYGLTPGQTYYFTVSSYNPYGEGDYATAVTALAGTNLQQRFVLNGTPTLGGEATNAVSTFGGAPLPGSFPYEAFNPSGQVVAVVGLVSPGGAWVGGTPQVAYSGVPSQTGETGTCAWAALTVTRTDATNALRYKAYWTNSTAGAVAAFQASPPTQDVAATEGLLGTVATTYDRDGDGIPDWWEARYAGGSPTGLVASVDGDGDGPDNGAEWIADTVPTNSASYFRLESTAGLPAAGSIVLRWNSASNRLYEVRRGTDLATGTFNPVATNLPATPPQNVYTDTVIGVTGPAFYQLGVQTTE